MKGAILLNMIQYKLFEEFKRTSKAIGKNLECTYDYINNSAKEDVSLLREILECWYSNYPKNEKFDLLKRMKKYETFDDAFFELYIHELFLKMGFFLTAHPKMLCSPNRPDYLAIKDECSIYIETKVDYNNSEKSRAKQNIINSIKDQINSIQSNNYKIILEDLDILSENQPSIKGFRKHITNHFSRLSYDEIKTQTETSFSNLPSYEYEDNGIRICYSIFYFYDKTRADPRIIYIDTSNKFEWGDCCNSLQKSLQLKANKYGEMRHPFIICINALDMMIDDEDVLNTIFGKLKTSLIINTVTNEVVEQQNYRECNGFFSTIQKRHPQVSAVLIFHMSAGTIGHPTYWYIENPQANIKINSNLIPLDKIVIKDNVLIKEVSPCKIYNILGIPEIWVK